jgi:hypothetical protein
MCLWVRYGYGRIVPDQQRLAPEPMRKPSNERRPDVVPLGIINVRLQERCSRSRSRRSYLAA